MAEKPRAPQGIQLADLLRRAGVQPPSVPSAEKPPEPTPPRPEPEEKPAPPAPEVEVTVSARAEEIEALREPEFETKISEVPEAEEERFVTIELTLTARQLAEILSERIPEVMTLEQAATYLHISPGYLADLCRNNRAPGFKVGRKWRFKKSVLDQWLAEAMDEHWQPDRADADLQTAADAEPSPDLRSL